jgi:hypothetical protein
MQYREGYWHGTTARICLMMLLTTAIWLALVTFGAYYIHSFGVPWLVAGAIMIFVPQAMYGTLTYDRARQRAESAGKRPPLFLVYLFFPGGVHHQVDVPRPVRVLLGITVLTGGLFFSFTTFFLWHVSAGKFGLGQVLGLLLLAGLGVACFYVGWRLMVMRAGEHLFKRGSQA